MSKEPVAKKDAEPDPSARQKAYSPLKILAAVLGVLGFFLAAINMYYQRFYQHQELYVVVSGVNCSNELSEIAVTLTFVNRGTVPEVVQSVSLDIPTDDGSIDFGGYGSPYVAVALASMDPTAAPLRTTVGFVVGPGEIALTTLRLRVDVPLVRRQYADRGIDSLKWIPFGIAIEAFRDEVGSARSTAKIGDADIVDLAQFGLEGETVLACSHMNDFFMDLFGPDMGQAPSMHFTERRWDATF